LAKATFPVVAGTAPASINAILPALGNVLCSSISFITEEVLEVVRFSITKFHVRVEEIYANRIQIMEE
jgi:hypothetical protein